MHFCLAPFSFRSVIGQRIHLAPFLGWIERKGDRRAKNRANRSSFHVKTDLCERDRNYVLANIAALIPRKQWPCNHIGFQVTHRSPYV